MSDGFGHDECDPWQRWAMDMGALPAIVYALLLVGVCAAFALSVAAASVAVRRARDPRRASRGFGVGIALGWALMVVTWAWVLLSGRDWVCCMAYPLGCAVSYGMARVICSPDPITSLSPDGAFRVALVDQPVFLQPDRNFEVWLEEVGHRQTRVVIRLPEEGAPAGSERVVWSADGSRFLVLGQHFAVTDRGRLSTGEQAYLMMDVRSGQVWCNASQQTTHPGFGVEDFRAVGWREWALTALDSAADRGLNSE